MNTRASVPDLQLPRLLHPTSTTIVLGTVFFMAGVVVHLEDGPQGDPPAMDHPISLVIEVSSTATNGIV